MAAQLNPLVTRRTALVGAVGTGLTGAAAWAAPPAGAAERSNLFVIQGATVFDGQRSLGRATVLVAGAYIAAVLPELPVPAGATVYDGRGQTVLPGLIDGHVHAKGLSPDPLRFGVTTELGMFGFPDKLGPYRRRRLSPATAAVSDLWTAGILATVPGGHGTQFGPIPTLAPDAGRAACAEFVAARLAEGSDYIKVIMEDGTIYGGGDTPTLQPATVGYLIDAAHRHGVLCMVHATAQRDAAIAAELGADGLAHAPGNPISDRTVRTIRDSGTFVTATLSVYNAISCAGAAQRLASDPLIAPLLTPQQRQELLPPPFPPYCYPDIYPAARDNVRALHEAGVPILAGTDAGNPGTTRGASLLSELTLLTDAGLTPVQALRAATSLPAQHFPIGPRGRIAPGHRADLTLVNGNATRDVTAVRDIAHIWRNGHVVDRRPDSSRSSQPTTHT